MIVIPAVDLRDGACVQLVGGSYARERVRLHDPLSVAREWVRLGFRRLHLVDLDAATGRGSNAALVRAVLAGVAAEVQVGGGIRETAHVEQLLAAGARWVIVGTRALEEPQWLADVAARHPQRLIVAADVRGRRVVTRGWERTLAREVREVIAGLDTLPLAGVLVTAVHREGRLGGTDLGLASDVVRACVHPVFAAGGVTTVDDLRALAEAGVSGAVVGMALYTRALDPLALVEELAP